MNKPGPAKARVHQLRRRYVMTDFIDKAILIGIGLEKKIRELAHELEEKGKEKEAEAEGQQQELQPKQRLENRIVEDGIKAVRELVALLAEGKKKVAGEVSEVAETITDRLDIATKSELSTLKEMIRVAREKVDRLEKRIQELEEERREMMER